MRGGEMIIDVGLQNWQRDVNFAQFHAHYKNND
jgi:hypothetical protein